MKRYLIGVLPHGSVGMCLEGTEDAVLNRIMDLIKQGPAICWHVTDQSPFSHGR